MSRTALTSTKTLIIAAVVALGAIGGGAVYLQSRHEETKEKPTTSVVSKTAAKTENISYQGVEGKTALEILKTKATVVTKTATGLGEYVVSVNGNDGGGTKYWLFYVNGKEAEVGAGAYITKNGDTIDWKLQ